MKYIRIYKVKHEQRSLSSRELGEEVHNRLPVSELPKHQQLARSSWSWKLNLADGRRPKYLLLVAEGAHRQILATERLSGKNESTF